MGGTAFANCHLESVAHLQRRMSNILEGMKVFCHIDDVIIFGRSNQEHDERQQIALKSIQAAGVTLNSE